MKTLVEVLTLTSQFLKEKKIGRARRTAEELIGLALGLKRMDLYMQFDRPMLEKELEVLRAFVKRAARGEPMAYIAEEVSFYKCDIGVTPDVLIPRPETEILVDLICKEFKLDCTPLAGKIAWDLCCGSGCMGIAIKKAFPELTVVLSDLSLSALSVAAENAQKNQTPVETLHGDLLTPFAGRRADFIFCNPPYVSPQDYEGLDPSVKDYEPKLALVAEEGGLGYYKRLKEGLPLHLNPHARVYLEIGSGQGDALLELFADPHWKGARVEKDWAGHERFFFLEFE